MQNTVSHNYTDLLHKETKDFMITLLIKISILLHASAILGCQKFTDYYWQVLYN